VRVVGRAEEETSAPQMTHCVAECGGHGVLVCVCNEQISHTKMGDMRGDSDLDGSVSTRSRQSVA
jgi:hypothetical protein